MCLALFSPWCFLLCCHVFHQRRTKEMLCCRRHRRYLDFAWVASTHQRWFQFSTTHHLDPFESVWIYLGCCMMLFDLLNSILTFGKSKDGERQPGTGCNGEGTTGPSEAGWGGIALTYSCDKKEQRRREFDGGRATNTRTCKNGHVQYWRMMET